MGYKEKTLELLMDGMAMDEEFGLLLAITEDELRNLVASLPSPAEIAKGMIEEYLGHDPYLHNVIRTPAITNWLDKEEDE